MKAASRILIASALAGALAACGGSKDEASTGDTAAPVAAPEQASAPEAATSPAVAANASPPAFAICKSCHSVEKDKHMIGPSLFAIVGTKAGEVQGYPFSAAMKASGLTWDDATLDAFLTSPMKVVPGTRMTYAGQSDPAKRKEIIEYLKTLK